MRSFAVVALVALCVVPAAEARAETPVHAVRWNDLKAEGKLVTGEVLPGTPGGALRVEGGSEGPYNIVIWTLENPPLTGKRWRLDGQVRHLGVEGEGQMVLLSMLDGREYFTKTVAAKGPLGRLEGDSDWRPFSLPFDALDRKVPPTKLTLQVFLSGRGTVDVSSLKLYPDFDDALVADLGPRLGWNAATFGLFSGLVGTIIALMGTLIGFLNASGKDPKYANGVRMGAIGLSIASIGAGAAAIATGAGGGWLISIGLIGIGVMSLVGRTMRKMAAPPPAAPKS